MAPDLRVAGGPPASERGGAPRRQGSGWAAAPAALRRHWAAVVLLAAGAALRLVAQLAYHPALFYIDTPRYLNNAEGMDPVGYKGLLLAILGVAGFGAVAAVQHLLGLAMAVVIYLLLRRHGAGRWLAAVAIAPVLLDAYQVQIEQTIMPDTLFEALIVTGLAILLWRPAPRWRRAAVSGAVLGASATVAQVGEALLLPAVICLLAAGDGWRRALGRAAALCVAFAVPILAYCTGSYLISGNFFLSHTGATSMYGRLAAAADCATLRLPAAERGMCPAPAQQANGPDWLEYGPTSPVRPYYAHLPRTETDRLITDFNRRVMAQQPLRVLGAYGRDVVKLFALTRDGNRGDTPISRWQFQPTFPYYPPHASPAAVRGLIGRFGGGGAPGVWRPGATFLRAYQLHGGYTPGPLLALFTVAALAGPAALLRRRARPPARQRALACLLLVGAAVFVLGVSDAFEFSWRYQLPALVTLAPAGALGLSMLVARPSAGPVTLRRDRPPGR